MTCSLEQLGKCIVKYDVEEGLIDCDLHGYCGEIAEEIRVGLIEHSCMIDEEADEKVLDIASGIIKHAIAMTQSYGFSVEELASKIIEKYQVGG